MNSTSFWQIAGLVMQVVELMLYIQSFNKYAAKLKDLGNDLYQKGDELFNAYKTLRDKTPAFFDYYRNLPDYTPCASAFQRSRGGALADYGKTLRHALLTIPGYTPLQAAAVANTVGQNVVQASTMKRHLTYMAEVNRMDNATLERWQAIISSPTHTARAADVTSIIHSNTDTLTASGQAANAAMYGIGGGLYKMGVLR